MPNKPNDRDAPCERLLTIKEVAALDACSQKTVRRAIEAGRLDALRLTEKAVGVRIPPHFFRDCVTTTLARRAPDAARLIRPILGHSGFRTAEKHYNYAQAIEAGRDYAALIDALKEHGE